jgi:hypothetical protein
MPLQILVKLAAGNIGQVTDFAVRGSSADQFACGLGERGCVRVDIRVGRGRAHQRHIVERRDQHAAIGQVKVQVLVEPLVGDSLRLAP